MSDVKVEQDISFKEDGKIVKVVRTETRYFLLKEAWDITTIVEE